MVRREVFVRLLKSQAAHASISWNGNAVSWRSESWSDQLEAHPPVFPHQQEYRRVARDLKPSALSPLQRRLIGVSAAEHIPQVWNLISRSAEVNLNRLRSRRTAIACE